MFCNHCGNELIETAKFCPSCGQMISPSVTSNSNIFTLTINRAKQWALINPPIKIIIDNNMEYKIANGSTLNIPISTGMHNIAFSFGIHNKVINLNITSHATLNVKWNRIVGGLEIN